MKNRRRHFLINKPLQFRYMAYLTMTVAAICLVALLSLYVGIWSSILDAFSDTKFREDLFTAARLSQYEEARHPAGAEPLTTLSFFKQTQKLSARQREIFKEILDRANRSLTSKLVLLFIFIAWGSVFLSHKIAGPLFRFHATLDKVQAGDLTIRIKLRKFDEAQDLCRDFNQALTYLDAHICRLKNILRENEKNHDRLVVRLKEELSRIKTSADQ